MTKTTTKKILALIGAAHGTDATAEMVDAWQLILHDVDDEAAIQATIQALRSSHFPPKPADILAATLPPMIDANAAYLEWQIELRDDAPIEDEHGNRRHRLPVWSNALVPAAGQHLDPEGGEEFAIRQSYVATYNRLLAEYQALGRLPSGVLALPAYQPRYSDEATLGPVLNPANAPRLGYRTREASELEKQLRVRELLAPVDDPA